MHVIHQCDGLSKVGHEVDLYLGSTSNGIIHDDVLRDFEAEFRSVNLIPVKTGKRRQGLSIAFHALKSMIGREYDLILSHNLYFSWVYANIFRKEVLYETHRIEKGFRALMQKQLLGSPGVTAVLISRKLKQTLEENYRITIHKSITLHDAAPEGCRPVDTQKKRIILSGLLSELNLDKTIASDQSTGLQIALAENPQNITAYFGKLHSNSGIERIAELAGRNTNDVFLIFGEINNNAFGFDKLYQLPNLFFMGHVPNGSARRLQATCDILLLPYQGNLSLGLDHTDSANCLNMSPIKLFEYMASGTPFISSDLPVFREVVSHRKHTILVDPQKPEAWYEAYRELSTTPLLRAELAHEAFKRYQNKFTWTSRARKIVEQSLTNRQGQNSRRQAA